MHPQLLDLDTKLTILANNPCACAVCRDSARFAKRALAEISPSSSVLLVLKPGTPEFSTAEQRFHADEIVRLQEAFDAIDKRICYMDPVAAQEPPAPAPEVASITPIPELPDADAFRDRVEFYRKHAVKPRMVHRRRSITMKKNPRIPGSYVIR